MENTCLEILTESFFSLCLKFFWTFLAFLCILVSSLNMSEHETQGLGLELNLDCYKRTLAFNNRMPHKFNF